MAEFNLAQLVADYCDSETRPIVRHPWCFNRSTLDKLTLLEVQLQSLEQELGEERQKQEDGKAPTRYGVASLTQIKEGEIKGVEAEIVSTEAAVEDASVVIVCRGLSAQHWGEFAIEHREDTRAASDRDLILEAFTHFERAGKCLPDKKDALAKVLDSMNYGDQERLASKVRDATAEVVDIPFSVNKLLVPPN